MNRIVGLCVGVILGMALIPAASHRTGYAQKASGPGVVDPVSGATGKNSMLPSTGLSVARRRWEAGSRTAWHSHTHGQLIFVEEGRARMQKRGQRIVELTVGQSDYTPPNVVHWHGAASGEHAIHVTVGFGEGGKPPESGHRRRVFGQNEIARDWSMEIPGPVNPSRLLLIRRVSTTSACPQRRSEDLCLLKSPFLLPSAYPP